MIDQLIQGASSRTLIFAIYQVLTELVSSPNFSKHPNKSIATSEEREATLLAASILREIRPGALTDVQVRIVVTSLSETLERNLKQAGVYEPSVGASLLATLRTKYEATDLGPPEESREARKLTSLSDKHAYGWLKDESTNKTYTKTYTVKAGDTLSKIAKEHLGDAKRYMKIFEANQDQLRDPSKIRPGQILKLPS